MAKKSPPELEDEGTTRDGAENANGNGGSIADRAEAPPVPEVQPNPLGPGGTVPMPGLPGRRKPPVTNKVVITQAACPGAGQLNPEEEQLLVVRAGYLKAVTTPHHDGEGRVKSFDYIQMCKPTWTEDLPTFLAANGYKLVRADGPGEAVELSTVVNIEEIRAEREGNPLD